MSKRNKSNERPNLAGWAAILTAVAALLGTLGFKEFAPKALAKLLSDSSPTTIEKIALFSEKNVDYAPLKNLLSEQDWQKASIVTYELMLKAAHKEREGYIDTQEMKEFPCADLLTIEKLWSVASNGKFGFRAQQEIWQNVGGRRYTEDKELLSRRFKPAVGWDEDQDFSLDDAPKGHFPVYREGRLTGGVASTHRVIDCEDTEP